MVEVIFVPSSLLFPVSSVVHILLIVSVLHVLIIELLNNEFEAQINRITKGTTHAFL